jgi:hypothetical protein
MNTKILPNTFISLGVLFVVTDIVAAAVRHHKLAAEGRLLAAGTSDGLLNSGNMPLRLPIITSDAADAGTGPNQGHRAIPTPRQAGPFCSPLFLRIARHNSPHPSRRNVCRLGVLSFGVRTVSTPLPQSSRVYFGGFAPDSRITSVERNSKK